MAAEPEYWLRGEVKNIPPLLQPVAHALLQAREEVGIMMQGFPPALLWVKPAGMAAAGFHLQHLTGVLDRLFTYARGASLTSEQLQALQSEGRSDNREQEIQSLLQDFHAQVARSLQALEIVDESNLIQRRFVGRAQLPSTVIGLLFHAAEHTMRHVGQLLVTVQVVKAGMGNQYK